MGNHYGVLVYEFRQSTDPLNIQTYEATIL